MSLNLDQEVFLYVKEKCDNPELLNSLAAVLNVNQEKLESQTCSLTNSTGISVTNTGTNNDMLLEKFEKLKEIDHFNKFFNNVSSKGYFKDTEENTEAYLSKLEKLIAKYESKFPNKVEEASKEKEAEEFKVEGNALLGQGKVNESISSYSKAIEVSPTGTNSHIYYSNRAAAYLRQENEEAWKKAIEDCNLSIGLNSKYTKSFTRMAQAYINLGQNDEAEKNLKLCLELDPENTVANNLMNSLTSTKSTAPVTGGMPGLGGMPGMGGMPNLGGMDFSNLDLNAMMNNPMVKQMAEQMSKDPSMMENMAKMMGGMNFGGQNQGGQN
eukprot:augustus_masked-scaffold_1-processed-gene-27.8-mRNA-1 protein AED:1.00 eAED:1.00 QI:0/-1/0/0/-1/1/1/0/325